MIVLQGYLLEHQCVDAGTTRVDDDREGDGNGQDKAQLGEVRPKGGREHSDDVTWYVLFIKGHIAKESNLHSKKRRLYSS